MDKREMVVKEAREWIGTGYCSHQQIKGGLCDCATLLAGVYGNAGVMEKFNLVERVGRYAPEWNVHGDVELYLQEIVKYCDEIKRDDVLPGDVFVFKFGRLRAHAGIVTMTTPQVQFVHSYNPGGVMETVLTPQWERLLDKCFRPRGL